MRKSAGGRASEKKASVKQGTAAALDFVLPDDMAKEFYGRMKEAFEADWKLSEPFILTGQAWLTTEVVQNEKFAQFMLDFNSAFEISTYKHSLGRAQKRLSDDVAIIPPFLAALKGAITDDELLFPVGPEGVDETKYAELASACCISAFCMGNASVSPPGFETGEVEQNGSRASSIEVQLIAGGMLLGFARSV